MAVNPATPVYGTDKNTNLSAVVDVDINALNPNHADRTSAKALAVVIATPSGGGGAGAAGFITTGPPYVATGDLTNGSGTITAGGVSQTVFAAGISKQGWAIQNQSSGYLYIRQSSTQPATQDQNSIRIAPGQEYVADYLNGLEVRIIGPTTGQAFWARSW